MATKLTKAMTPLQQLQERKLGNIEFDRRTAEFEAQCKICPPISAQLLKHLDVMFADPATKIKPNDPMLPQHLIVQYGIDLIKRYLAKQHKAQSEAAQKGRTV